MDKLQDTLEQSKGNIEMEGMEVPNVDGVKFLVNKYKDKLGDEALDSLLYSLYMGSEIYKEEKNAKQSSKRSSK